MLLKIFSASLNFIGVADDYSSVRITRRFRDSPEITVKAKFSDNIKMLFLPGNFIMSSEADETFLIDYVSYDNEKTESRSAFVTIKARGVLSMLSRRAVKYRILHSGSLGVLMGALVTEAGAAMPGYVSVDISAISKTVIYEQDYTDTMAALADMCRIFGVGMKMQFIPETKSFCFYAFKEVDFTVNQSVNPPVLYSREHENVIDEFYAIDASGYKNVAYVYGSEDRAGGRYNVTVGNASAADRREVYVYANDLSVRRYETLSGGVLSINTASYYAALTRRGQEVLAKHPVKKSLSVTINPIAYEKIAKLGSICTLINRDWDIEADVVLTEDEWVVENGKVSRSITLGNELYSSAV